VPQALKEGVLFVSEDRAAEGIFPTLTVLENLVATRLRNHVRNGLLSWRALRSTAARLARSVLIDEQRLASRALDLSGGSQQKLLFARAVDASAGAVLLMNEPTRGVDVGARSEIYRLMHGFCERGYVLVMASSDLEEIAGMADHVLTMYRGRVVGQYARGNIATATLLADITHPVGAAA
jgi:ABC-type sugar transport system ATPase subunit